MSDPGISARTDVATAESLRSWLTGQVADYLGHSAAEIRPDVMLTEYGLDSVHAVCLAAAIEDHLSVYPGPTVAWDYPTIDELVQLLLQELAAGVAA